MLESHTPRFLLADSIRCYCEVTAWLWLAARMTMDNAIFHLWRMGMLYTQLSVGGSFACHTVLLRSDGCAVACGRNDAGQCNMPELEKGESYTQVSAGGFYTVLLRSNGTAVACGNTAHGQREHSAFWRKECRTFRFLQVGIIQCFSEVMVLP